MQSSTVPPAKSADRSSATIAVVGLGAIGSVIAATLSALGRHDVVACARHPVDHLVVERADDALDQPIHALTDPAAAKPVDWVLLSTKVHHVPSVAPWLGRLCGPHTRVATLQNGIDHAARLAPFVGLAKVVPTIVYFNGERLAPNRVRYRRVGEHDLFISDDPDGEAFVTLLDGSHLSVRRTADFATLAWRKLLINTVANPVTALTMQRQSVFRRPDIKALCMTVLEEAAAIGCADGAHLEDNEAEHIMALLLSAPADAGTSMYFDRRAGRALEIDALTGEIVARGARYGIPTPVNAAMLALLRAVSDTAGTEKPLP